jgi:hypothetical protein
VGVVATFKHFLKPTAEKNGEARCGSNMALVLIVVKLLVSFFMKKRSAKYWRFSSEATSLTP